MRWVLLVVLLGLIGVMSYAARRLQGGRSNDGFSVTTIDHEYDKIQQRRIEEHDPFRGGPEDRGELPPGDPGLH